MILYSTSGSSENIRKTADICINKKANIILITGKNKEDWHNDLTRVIRIQSLNTALIQECSLIITHIICEAIDNDY